MSDRSIMRRVLDSMLPKGSIWNIKSGGNLDKYFDAFAANLTIGLTAVKKVETVRDPEKTSALYDLEVDFGVLPDSAISDAERRTYLSGIKGSSQLRTGSAPELQARLRAAGFDVYVYQNEPAIDPSTVFFSVPNMTAGDVEATAGGLNVTAGYGPGGDSELIVNGDMITQQEKLWEVTADSDPVWTAVDADAPGASEHMATAGAFLGMVREKYYYPLPKNEARWKFVFWICGSKTQYNFEDWNMEHSGVAKWTDGGGALVTKTLDYKSSGIRGLLVQAWWPDVIGPYAEQTLADPVTEAVTVKVTAWDFGTYAPGLMVCDKDGVWDVAGIVLGATTGLGEGYELSYSATNGVSAVRLYAWGALFGWDGQAVFDDLIIEGATFTRAQVPIEQRLALRKMILKLKPLETWAALLVDYTYVEPVATVFEEDETMVDNYRYQTTSAAGTLDIIDTEVFHIAFKGTAAGYIVRFDDARNFTMVGTPPNDGRMFRLTNNSTEGIVVTNFDLSYQKTLPPKGVMQVSLSDNTTLAGVWEFSTHVTGDAEEVPV